jgi:hypothetical protein
MTRSISTISPPSTTAALFFDVDGTLIGSRTSAVPSDALDALRLAKANGHLLFINSGRTFCAICPELKNDAFDGFLCGCGTYISYHGKVLLKRSLAPRRGDAILDKMQECNIDTIIEANDEIYLPRCLSRFANLEEHRKYYVENFGLTRAACIEDRGFVYDKLFVYTDEQSDKQAFFDFLKGDMEIIDRGRGTYEITPKGCSKAAACEYIVSELGLDRENTYAFGDSTNDLSMFQYARHAIAMGKHSKELEPYTEFVTKDVEDGGIAHALAHYQLI